MPNASADADVTTRTRSWRHWRRIIFLLLLALWGGTAWWHTHKDLPTGTHLESAWRLVPAANVTFIADITAADAYGRPVMSQAIFDEVLGVMDGMKSDYATAVALIVAAKHSLYKCLHPQVGRSFGYLDASIEDVQRSTGRFRARLKVMLSPAWVGGTIVTGQYEVVGDFIYTGLAIPC